MKTKILIIVIILIIAWFGFVQLTEDEPSIETEVIGGETLETDISSEENTNIEVTDWRNAELTDVVSGETFRISDFAGKPVLLESFAVWCPTCLRQQKEIDKLFESEGDSIIHISINTDPNETASITKDHANNNGFEWFFAVSSAELTKNFIETFGITFVNAPSAPVVLVCEDQSTRFFEKRSKVC